MVEFSCDLRIVQAIDLSGEWRKYADALDRSKYWYAGWIGSAVLTRAPLRGTYSWPFSCRRVYGGRSKT